MIIPALLGGGLGLILLGGAASLILARAPGMADLVTGLLVISGLLACAGEGAAALFGGARLAVTFPTTVPGGPWAIAVDPLAGWFLMLLGLAGAAAMSYGIRYLAPERGHRPVAVAHALATVLLASMVVVIVAHAAVLFLVAWEIMAVSAYFLIMFEGERAEVRRAGLIYLVVTHTGTLSLIAMFLVWGRTAPDLTFQSLAAAAPGVPWGGGLVLLLALVGFGAKAGIVPFHFWLPGAHAAAPSHVSALLSGVMLKMGIYGILRVLSLLGPAPAWFGWTLFGLGLASGVLGVLWALNQEDLKRVLAYSSVENIGIILLGLGVGVLGLAYRQPVVAALGFTGALLHSMNHALFKSLLFMGAGAVVRATGTRVMDRMGGLGRRLPLTAVAFGVGSVAIVGLPPLNGFVGEWIAVQGLLHGAQIPGVLALLVLAVAGLGLIGALALTCFSRVAGTVFLGHPRSQVVSGGDAAGLVVPMAGLAALCIILGALPALEVRPAATVVQGLLGGASAGTADAASVLRQSLPSLGAVAALVAGLVAAGWYLRWRNARHLAPRHASTWGCAYGQPTTRMQYTASSYSAPVLHAFAAISAPRISREGGALTTQPGDRVLGGLVLPLWKRVHSVAESLRPLQEGRITRYLQYMVLTVLLLLGALFASIVRQP